MRKKIFDYTLIPVLILGLMVVNEVYVNIPKKDERPRFCINGMSVVKEGDLRLEMNVERWEGRVGDEFIVNFKMRNEGTINYSIRTTLPIFDMNVYDLNGAWLGNWSAGRQLTPNKFLIIIPLNEDFTETKVWDLTMYNQEGEPAPLEVGRYWVSGVWLCGPIIETGKIPLVIGEPGP